MPQFFPEGAPSSEYSVVGSSTVTDFSKACHKQHKCMVSGYRTTD
jgi:hypothetical protein